MEPPNDSGDGPPKATSSRVGARRRRLVAPKQRACNPQATNASNSEKTTASVSPTESSTTTSTTAANNSAPECNTTITTPTGTGDTTTLTLSAPDNNSDQCHQEPAKAAAPAAAAPARVEGLDSDGQQQQPLVTAGLLNVLDVPPVHLGQLPEPQSNNDVTSSVNAVRVLFRNRELQRLQRHQQQQQTSNPQSQTSSGRTQILNRASLVSANRRLIERQIEAIQAADSRRWNFDFRNCRPLARAGHRYVHINQPARNCRPLSDQKQSAPTRFNDH